MSDEVVKLICRDGEEVEVILNIAEKSGIIKGILEDSPDDKVVPITKVRKEILEKAIEFCSYITTNLPLPEIE